MGISESKYFMHEIKTQLFSQEMKLSSKDFTLCPLVDKFYTLKNTNLKNEEIIKLINKVYYDWFKNSHPDMISILSKINKILVNLNL